MKRSTFFRIAIPVLILLVTLTVAYVIQSSKKPLEKVPVLEEAFLVGTQDAFAKPVEFDIYSQGNVVPKNKTRISVQVSGKIASVANNFVEGGFVARGDVLVTLEQDDYITEVKLAEAELAQANATLEEEIARGKVAEQEWRSVNSSVPPALGLRKPQLAGEKANVLASEAKLERAKRNLARTKIKAPYNGLVVSRDIDLGQFLTIGAQIGEVFSTDDAQVRIPLSSNDLAFLNLRAGIKANNSVVLSANIAGRLTTWKGRLVRSEEILDSNARVIYAIAEVTDPYMLTPASSHDQILRFGQFVNVVISGTRTEHVFVLPRSLLRLDNTVLAVNNNRELQIKPVVLARSDANYVYIQSGLNSGDKVVTTSVPNAFNGMKVRLPEDEESDKESNKESDTESDENIAEKANTAEGSR